MILLIKRKWLYSVRKTKFVQAVCNTYSKNLKIFTRLLLEMNTFLIANNEISKKRTIVLNASVE